MNTPVLTTIIQLFPPGLAGEPVYRVMLGDQEINRWRFEFVNLWEVAVERAFAATGPGLLALVPLLKGGQEPGAVRRAALALDASAVLSNQETLDAFAVPGALRPWRDCPTLRLWMRSGGSG